MASKGPGAFIALGAALALLALSGGKKSKGGGKSGLCPGGAGCPPNTDGTCNPGLTLKNGICSLPGIGDEPLNGTCDAPLVPKVTQFGTVCAHPDGSDSGKDTDKGGTQSGGDPVGPGKGTGGGGYVLPDPGPAGLAISPDCLAVIEGPNWYEQTFIPVAQNLLRGGLAVSCENYADDTSVKIPVSDIGNALPSGFSVEQCTVSFSVGAPGNLRSLMPPWSLIGNFFGVTEGLISDMKALQGRDLAPWQKCILQFPLISMFVTGDGANLLASQGEFPDSFHQNIYMAMARFRDQRPALYDFLMSLRQRMLQDERLSIDAVYQGPAGVMTDWLWADSPSDLASGGGIWGDINMPIVKHPMSQQEWDALLGS